MKPMEQLIATVTSTSDPGDASRSPRAYLSSPDWRAKWIGLDEHHAEVLEMSMAAEQFVKRCLTDDGQPRLLVLSGKNGVGKTTVAQRIIEAVGLIGISAWSSGRCRKPPMSRSYHWQRLASVKPGDRQGETLWTECVELDMALLDDIGAEVDQFKSGLAAENLRLMLEERKAKWTVVTTNIMPRDWSKAWDQRVEDRLHRNSIIVELKTAPSYLRRE